MIWREINYPQIAPGYVVSPDGYIKAQSIDDSSMFTTNYHSTNGYDYVSLYNINGHIQLFPIDDIIALTYIPIPKELKEKLLKVIHINNDTRDISLNNLKWIEDVEEWRICTYPDIKPNTYEVSSWGRIRNIKTNEYIKLIPHQEYIDVRLLTNDGLKSIRHHRIIGWEFVLLRDLDKVINHINGIKSNNNPKNLEWVTSAENTRHAYYVGLKHKLYKSNNPNAKITLSDATTIFDELIKNNGNIKQTYELLKNSIPQLTYVIVLDIKNGNSSWLTDVDNPFTKRKFVSDNTIIDIANSLLMHQGHIPSVYNELKNRYPKLTKSYISKIKNKYRHSDITDNIFTKDDMIK